MVDGESMAMVDGDGQETDHELIYRRSLPDPGLVGDTPRHRSFFPTHTLHHFFGALSERIVLSPHATLYSRWWFVDC